MREYSRYRVGLAADIGLSQATLLPNRGDLGIRRVSFSAGSKVRAPALDLSDLLVGEGKGAGVLFFHLAQDPNGILLAFWWPGQDSVENLFHLLSCHAPA